MGELSLQRIGGGKPTSLLQNITLPSGIANHAVVATIPGTCMAFVMWNTSSTAQTTGAIIAPQPEDSYTVELTNDATYTYYAKVTFTENSAVISHYSKNTAYGWDGPELPASYTVGFRGVFV